MNRRELLKQVSILTGAAVIGADFFLTGCKTSTTATLNWETNILALLNEIGETILPKTSSPGAKEADVAAFMKVYVTDCYTPTQQNAFAQGLTKLEKDCKAKFSKAFTEITPEQRIEFLSIQEKEAEEYNKKANETDKPLREAAKKANKEFESTPQHGYTMLKQMTLIGFFTSKVGATQALRHVPVPGKYDGALPYTKGEKAFA